MRYQKSGKTRIIHFFKSTIFGTNFVYNSKITDLFNIIYNLF